jgi:NDP-sugar pyrophosphorylase family protein
MLFPVGDRPLIDWTLGGLSRCGVDTVVMAVNYMADALINHLGSSRCGVDIVYSREQRPLGTGGPIKKAKNLLEGEPFLVLNGDILSDIDFSQLVKRHRETGATVTVALTPVADPSRYGAVEVTAEGMIRRFVEKPARGTEPSNLINAGAYVLDTTVLDCIPEGRVSMERDVFPILAAESRLYGYESRGLWMDMGVPDDYLCANRMILRRFEGGVREGEGAKIEASTRVISPCYIGVGAEILANSRVGPNATISDHVEIGESCVVENSVIFPGATIGDNSTVRDAIIGENAIIGRGAKVESGSLVGDYSTIRDGVTITGGVSICPSKEVGESILEHRQVM